MNKFEYSKHRDLLALKLQSEAQAPFVKVNKRGEEELTVDYTVWNSLENLEKHAFKMHSELKNLWKWVKKTYPYPDNEKFMKLDLVNLLFILINNLDDELTKWKSGLMSGKPYLHTFSS